MASEESRFVARAERLAGPTGVVGFQAAAAREAAFAPQNRYVLPQFEEKTPYGFKRQDPYTRLFEDRIIFMGVQVDDTSADDIMAQLLVLESQDPNRDVMMYINSPGGSMTAMTAIYDTMQYIKPDVQTVCLGQAASAAAILLAAGAKGKRLMLPNARVLIHQPAIDQGFGKATEIEIQAKEMLRMREWLENTLAKHTGRDVEKIRKDIEKTKEKISVQQKRLRELEAQLTEEENLEIVRMVKAVRMDNKELTAFLKAYASGLITLPDGMMEAEAAADPDDADVEGMEDGEDEA